MARAVDHAERRRVFAAAALRVIMRDGVAGLTVRAVASEAGFTTGALTHYFQSKDQLLIEASELSAELVREQMGRAERTSPPLEAVRKVVSYALPTSLERRGYWRIWLAYWERSSYDPDVARVMRLRYDEWRGRLERLIRRAQAEREISADLDARQAAEALIALIDGIGVQVVLGVSRISARRQHDLFEAWLQTVTCRQQGAEHSELRSASSARRTTTKTP